MNERLGRRDALVGIGAAAVGAASGLPAIVRADGPAASPPSAASASAVEAGVEAEQAPAFGGCAMAATEDRVRALFGALREGSAVSTHWRLEALYGVRGGGFPVVLSNRRGDCFAVEILRRGEDGPPPVATAGPLAFYLVNRGDGGSPTDETNGLGAMALASALEARLRDGAPVPPGLLTQRRRLAWEPDGAFDVPLD